MKQRSEVRHDYNTIRDVNERSIIIYRTKRNEYNWKKPNEYRTKTKKIPKKWTIFRWFLYYCQVYRQFLPLFIKKINFWSINEKFSKIKLNSVEIWMKCSWFLMNIETNRTKIFEWSNEDRNETNRTNKKRRFFDFVYISGSIRKTQITKLRTCMPMFSNPEKFQKIPLEKHLKIFLNWR